MKNSPGSLYFGVNLATLAAIVREVELHRTGGWAKGVPIVTGDGRVIVTGEPNSRQSTTSPTR